MLSFLHSKMFCANCGCKVEEETACFCSICGKELLATQSPSFGRPTSTSLKSLPSFVEFKTGKGKPCKKDLSKGKGKGPKLKEESPDVTIQIGLKYFDANDEKLKEKRGKRLTVRVKRDAGYQTLLETPQRMWKTYHKDLYDEGAEYTLILEDCQEACFMPGSHEEFFQLNKYKEAIMKDYKRITLFLCTVEDLKGSEIDSKEEDEMSHHFAEPPPKKKTFVPTASTSTSGVSDASSSAVQAATKPERNLSKDEDNWFYLDELDRLYSIDSALPDLSAKHNQITDVDCEAEVVKKLREKVVTDGITSLFIVIRRGAPVRRAISLWQRATQKVNPIHVCRIKFIGEDGIDDGALAREFFTATIHDIGKTYFPYGSPIYSTNNVSTYRTIGEIVASSIAQGGPAPGFLAPSVFDTLVSEDIDYSSKDLCKLLTENEQQILDKIKKDVASCTDIILDHGYTGTITTSNVESIANAVAVSMLSRRQLMLKEFKQGLELYGLLEIVVKFPQHCKALFVLGKQEPVDANYLFSLLKPEYSSQDSPRHSTEQSIMDIFQDFVFSVEDEKKVSGYTEALAWKSLEGTLDSGDESEEDRFNEAVLSPSSLMGWLTGQTHRDLVEQLPIYVKFDHDEKKSKPQDLLPTSRSMWKRNNSSCCTHVVL